MGNSIGKMASGILIVTAEADNIRAARLLISLMKLCGIWSFPDKWWNKYYRLYGWLLHFHFTFLFIFMMYVKIGLAKNLDELSESLYMSLTETALMVKVITALRNTQRLVELFRTFETYADGRPANGVERQITAREQRKFSYLRNMHIAGSIFVLTTGSISSLLDGSYDLPFPCWMPFDYHNDKKFYYAFTFVVLGMLVTAVSNLTLDLVQSYLMFQLAFYYKLLCSRWESNKWMIASNDNVDGRAKMEKEIKQLFQFHGYISRLSSYCESLISFPIFVQILISAFVICFTMYLLQKINILEDPSTFVTYFVFALVMALQIYIPCRYGDDLSVSSQALIRAVYSSNWTEAPLWVQKEIFVYMESLKRPVIIKAGHFFDIDLNVFTQTLNNAYRIYAVLLKMKS